MEKAGFVHTEKEDDSVHAEVHPLLMYNSKVHSLTHHVCEHGTAGSSAEGNRRLPLTEKLDGEFTHLIFEPVSHVKPPNPHFNYLLFSHENARLDFSAEYPSSQSLGRNTPWTGPLSFHSDSQTKTIFGA